MKSLVACSTVFTALLLLPEAAAARQDDPGHAAPRLRLDAATLTPPAGTPLRVASATRKGDSLKNGAILGAIVGGIYGAIGWGRVMEGPAARIAVIAAYTGGGALVGTCIDAMHVRREDPVRRPVPARPSVKFRVRF